MSHKKELAKSFLIQDVYFSGIRFICLKMLELYCSYNLPLEQHNKIFFIELCIFVPQKCKKSVIV